MLSLLFVVLAQAESYDVTGPGLVVKVQYEKDTGTMHYAESLSMRAGREALVLDGGAEAGLPLVERVIGAGEGRWVVLGWISGGGGSQTDVAWLVVRGARGLSVADKLERSTRRSVAGLVLAKDGAAVGVPEDDYSQTGDERASLRLGKKSLFDAELVYASTPLEALCGFYTPPFQTPPAERRWSGRFAWFAPGPKGFTSTGAPPACGAPAHFGTPGVLGAGPVIIEAGPLTLEIHLAATSHVFHVVDQLSNWSQYCHQQYRRALQPLSAEDEALLVEHATLRKARRYGVLDQAFYTELPLAEAIERALRDKQLTAAEADVERRVLTHFEARASAMQNEGAPVLQAAIAEVQRRLPEIKQLAEQMSRFVGNKSVRLQAQLLVSPSDTDRGGGFNGGVLTLEVPRKGQVLGTLVHEAFHAFLRTQQAAIDAAVAKTPGLDETTLGEGMAYALMPGMVHDEAPGSDPLLDLVTRDLRDKKSFSDAYVRFNRFGLALRPLLSAALDDSSQSLQSFLPRACDAFVVTRELSRARQPDSSATAR